MRPSTWGCSSISLLSNCHRCSRHFVIIRELLRDPHLSVSSGSSGGGIVLWPGRCAARLECICGEANPDKADAVSVDDKVRLGLEDPWAGFEPLDWSDDARNGDCCTVLTDSKMPGNAKSGIPLIPA